MIAFVFVFILIDFVYLWNQIVDLRNYNNVLNYLKILCLCVWRKSNETLIPKIIYKNNSIVWAKLCLLLCYIMNVFMWSITKVFLWSPRDFRKIHPVSLLVFMAKWKGHRPLAGMLWCLEVLFGGYSRLIYV